jgi:hypothetical protein
VLKEIRRRPYINESVSSRNFNYFSGRNIEATKIDTEKLPKVTDIVIARDFDGFRKHIFALLVGLLWISMTLPGIGQESSNALRVTSQTVLSFDSDQTIPFWLWANQAGGMSWDGSQEVFRLDATFKSSPLGHDDELTLSFQGISRWNPARSSTIFINELFAHYEWRKLSVTAGRAQLWQGLVDPDLSSGSLLQSQNASGIPRIRVGLTDFVSIPWTDDWVGIRGHMGHAWLEGSRYVERPYLFESAGYLRVGRPKWITAQIGSVHDAFWGGEHPIYGTLPHSFADFWKVFTAQAGDEDAPSVDRNYKLGNHVGAWEIRLDWFRARDHLFAYAQIPYEDQDNLLLKNPGDGLFGLGWKTNKMRVSANFQLLGVLYEYLYTKWQHGPIGPSQMPGYGGRDNYFNHSLYRSGWSYQGQSLGSPFITLGILPGLPDDEARALGFVNNRVVAHYVGFKARSYSLKWSFKASYSRNYGTYDGKTQAQEEGRNYYFEDGIEQWSLGLGAGYNWPGLKQLQIHVNLAYDYGSLYSSSWGTIIGASWDFR